MSHGNEMYYEEDSNYVIFHIMTDDNYAYHGHHFKMYRNIESLCCVTGANIVLQVSFTSETNKQKKAQKNKSDMQLLDARHERKGGLGEGSQKVQTPSYKINKQLR